MSNKIESPKPFGWICTGQYGAYQFFRADFMRMEWLEGEDAHAFKPLYEQSPLHDAAPDLLETAQAVSDAWAKFIDSFDYVPGIGDLAEDIEFQEMARLRRAISKALA